MSDQYDVIVVGLGAMGSAASYQLAKSGAKVLGIDRYEPPHIYGSTHGDTRITRLAIGEVADYMAKHQHDQNADELWQYFQNVIAWVRDTFTNYRGEMKKVEWGMLYNEFKDAELDPEKLEVTIKELMQDEDVTKKSGIYPYVLNGKEKHLSIRAFTDKMKREAYERQNGVCPKCGKHFEINEMEADHIKPWVEGGHTTASNCQMLCKDDNRRKSNI